MWTPCLVTFMKWLIKCVGVLFTFCVATEDRKHSLNNPKCEDLGVDMCALYKP